MPASSLAAIQPSHSSCTHVPGAGFNPQFVPKIEGISALFQRPLTAASWLIHIWAINLFLGRVIYTEGKLLAGASVSCTVGSIARRFPQPWCRCTRLQLNQVLLCPCVVTGGVPTWHSLLLACFLGPLGYVSHALTKLVWKAAAKPVIIQDKESNGSITLLPYDQ